MNTLAVHWPISKKLNPHEPRLTTYIDIPGIAESTTSDLIHEKYYDKEKQLNYDNHKSVTFPSFHNNNIDGVWPM
tara:strand:- start:51 stop:275 length:225 start_codon:yes stop_codon:yes gene_type:complete